MIKYILSILSLCIVLLLTSCSKSTEDKKWQAEITENKAESLKEVFLQNGSEKLLDIIDSKDEVKMSNYNETKANQIASYFQDKFNVDITKEFIDNPEGIVILGLFYAKKEQLDASSQIKTNSTIVMKQNDPNDCFWAVITGLIGLTDAKNVWKAFSAGISEETIFAAAKLIGKRVGSVIVTLVAVDQLGECMGWW
jgi:uncharacterized membrane protein YeaQ/YmgE (transglycosylase-associated protein family)